MSTLDPPPEARLIRRLRERPPHMSKRQAAELAGISEAWWRSLENGYKHFRGTPYPERGNAQTIARMARVVDATPQQLTEAGRPDAAAELEVLIAAVEAQPELPGMSGRQKHLLTERMRRDAHDG